MTEVVAATAAARQEHARLAQELDEHAYRYYVHRPPVTPTTTP
jgi:hypothetical protein